MPGEAAKLERRLEIGWQKCEVARSAEERQRLEDFWIKLLDQYQALCDRQGTGVLSGVTS
jgi:hypothetical protein